MAEEGHDIQLKMDEIDHLIQTATQAEITEAVNAAFPAVLDHLADIIRNPTHCLIAERMLCLVSVPMLLEAFAAFAALLTSESVPIAELLALDAGSHILQTLVEHIPKAWMVISPSSPEMAIIIAVAQVVLDHLTEVTTERGADVVASCAQAIMGAEVPSTRHTARGLTVNAIYTHGDLTPAAAQLILSTVTSIATDPAVARRLARSCAAPAIASISRQVHRSIGPGEAGQLLGACLETDEQAPTPTGSDSDPVVGDEMVPGSGAVVPGVHYTWAPSLPQPDRKWVSIITVEALKQGGRPAEALLAHLPATDDVLLDVLTDPDSATILVAAVHTTGGEDRFIPAARHCVGLLSTRGDLPPDTRVAYGLFIEAVGLTTPDLLSGLIDACLNPTTPDAFITEPAALQHAVLRAALRQAERGDDAAAQSTRAIISSIISTPPPAVAGDPAHLQCRLAAVRCLADIFGVAPGLAGLAVELCMISWTVTTLNVVGMAEADPIPAGDATHHGVGSTDTLDLGLALLDLLVAAARGDPRCRTFIENEITAAALVDPTVALARRHPADLPAVLLRVLCLASTPEPITQPTPYEVSAVGHVVTSVDLVELAVTVAARMREETSPTPGDAGLAMTLDIIRNWICGIPAHVASPNCIALAQAGLSVTLLTTFTDAIHDRSAPIHNDLWDVISILMQRHTLPAHLRTTWRILTSSPVACHAVAGIVSRIHGPSHWLRLRLDSTVAYSKGLSLFLDGFPRIGYSIAAWVRFRSDVSFRLLTVGSISLICHPDRLELQTGRFRATVPYPADLERGVWMHVVVVHIQGDGSVPDRAMFYINGTALMVDTATPLTFPTAREGAFRTVRIGGAASQTSVTQSVHLGSVLLFHAPLTPADVFALFTHDPDWCGTALPLPTVAGPDSALDGVAMVEHHQLDHCVSDHRPVAVGGGDVIPPRSVTPGAIELLLTRAHGVLGRQHRDRAAMGVPPHVLADCTAAMATMSRRVAVAFTPAAGNRTGQAGKCNAVVLHIAKFSPLSKEQTYAGHLPTRQWSLTPVTCGLAPTDPTPAGQSTLATLGRLLKRRDGTTPTPVTPIPTEAAGVPSPTALCRALPITRALHLVDAVPALMVRIAGADAITPDHLTCLLRLLVTIVTVSQPCLARFIDLNGISCVTDSLVAHPEWITQEVVTIVVRLTGLEAEVHPRGATPERLGTWRRVAIPLTHTKRGAVVRCSPLDATHPTNAPTPEPASMVYVRGHMVMPDAMKILVDTRLFPLASTHVQRAILAIVGLSLENRRMFDLMQARPHSRLLSIHPICSALSRRIVPLTPAIPPRRPPTGIPIPHQMPPLNTRHANWAVDQTYDPAAIARRWADIPRLVDVAYSVPHVSGVSIEGVAPEEPVIFDLLASLMHLAVESMDSLDRTVADKLAECMVLLAHTPYRYTGTTIPLPDIERALALFLAAPPTSYRMTLLEFIYQSFSASTQMVGRLFTDDAPTNVATFPVLLGGLMDPDASVRAALFKVLRVVLESGDDAVTERFRRYGGFWILSSLDIDVQASDIAALLQLFVSHEHYAVMDDDTLELIPTHDAPPARLNSPFPEALVAILGLLGSVDVSVYSNLLLVKRTCDALLTVMVAHPDVSQHLYGEDSLDLLCSLIVGIAVAWDDVVVVEHDAPAPAVDQSPEPTLTILMHIVTRFIVDGRADAAVHILAHLEHHSRPTHHCTRAAIQVEVQRRFLLQCLDMLGRDDDLRDGVTTLEEVCSIIASQLSLWASKALAIDMTNTDPTRTTSASILAGQKHVRFIECLFRLFNGTVPESEFTRPGADTSGILIRTSFFRILLTALRSVGDGPRLVAIMDELRRRPVFLTSLYLVRQDLLFSVINALGAHRDNYPVHAVLLQALTLTIEAHPGQSWTSALPRPLVKIISGGDPTQKSISRDTLSGLAAMPVENVVDAVLDAGTHPFTSSQMDAFQEWEGQVTTRGNAAQDKMSATWGSQLQGLRAKVASQVEACRGQISSVVGLLGQPMVELKADYDEATSKQLREELFNAKRDLERPNMLCSRTLGQRPSAVCTKVRVGPGPGLRWDDLDSDTDSDGEGGGTDHVIWGLCQHEGRERQRLMVKRLRRPQHRRPAQPVDEEEALEELTRVVGGRAGATDISQGPTPTPTRPPSPPTPPRPESSTPTPTDAAPVRDVLLEAPCVIVSALTVTPAQLTVSTLGLDVAMGDPATAGLLPPVLADVVDLCGGLVSTDDAVMFGKALRCRTKRVALADIHEVHHRRFLLQDIGIEVFMGSHATFIVMDTTGTRDAVVRKILGLNPPNLTFQPRDLGTRLKEVTAAWQDNQMTNFDYLMRLNTLSGRTYNDLTQYPVFPFILSDYTSTEIDLTDPTVYRDLSKPMGAQDPTRLEQFMAKYHSLRADGASLGADLGAGVLGRSKPYMYGTHYSNSATALHYLVRLEPYASRVRALQGTSWDDPDRMFTSIARLWLGSSRISRSEVRELIPEFYYLPDFLMNVSRFDFGVRQDGERVNDVVLPPWARTPADFIAIHRQALESQIVSASLHKWVDLIFGFRQTGKAAVAACNVFHPMTYPGAVSLGKIEDAVDRASAISMTLHFGQCPRQIFTKPHPKRHRDKTVPTILTGQLTPTPAPPRPRPPLRLSGGMLTMCSGHRGHRSSWTFVTPADDLCTMSCCGPHVVSGAQSGLVIFSRQHVDASTTNVPTVIHDTITTVHRGAVTAIAVNTDWDVAVTGDDKGLCVVWKISSRSVRMRRTPHTNAGGAVTSVAISPVNGDVAIGSRHRLISNTSTVNIWSINGVHLGMTPVGLADVTAMAFVEAPTGHGGRRLACGLSNGNIDLVGLDPGQSSLPVVATCVGDGKLGAVTLLAATSGGLHAEYEGGEARAWAAKKKK